SQTQINTLTDMIRRHGVRIEETKQLIEKLLHELRHDTSLSLEDRIQKQEEIRLLRRFTLPMFETFKANHEEILSRYITKRDQLQDNLRQPGGREAALLRERTKDERDMMLHKLPPPPQPKRR